MGILNLFILLVIQAADSTKTADKIVDKLFTPETIFTLGGASIFVTMFCNTIRAVFNFEAKWVALLLSILISIIGVIYKLSNLAVPPPAKPPIVWFEYFLGLANGILIFCTATGMNKVASAGFNRQGRATSQKTGKRNFFDPWF